MYRTRIRTPVISLPARQSYPLPATISYLQALWIDLNDTYFQSRLLPIEIMWSSRLTSSVGLFVSQTGPRDRHVSYEVRHGKARMIRLSFPLLTGTPEAEIRGTLAHEMIHQWQFDVQKRRPSHGVEFYRIMTMMNQDGLGVTVYHSLTKEVEAFARYEWRCLQCGKEYRRQRRTISPARHQCRVCLGSLKEVSVQSRMGAQPPSRLFQNLGQPIHEARLCDVPEQLTLDFS